MPEKKKKSNDSIIEQISLQAGKIPPQAVDLEEAVLGAIMIEKDAVIPIIDILKPEAFYKDAHRIIFEAMLELSKKLIPIDLLTITEELRKQKKLEEVGGAFYITQLTSKVASAAHMEFHAKIIAQKFIQREMIRITSDIQRNAFDDSEDVDILLDRAESDLFELSQGVIKREVLPIGNVLKRAIKEIEEIEAGGLGLSGVPSGFTGLDRITGGWQKSDLIIIAARPSMGKTAFVLSMARKIAVEHKRVVAFFSLEMSSVQLVNRLIVSETELPSEKIRNGNLKDFEWEQLEYKVRTLENAPIYIDDTPALSVFELRAKCRRLKAQYGVDVVVVDYLQLMSTGIDSKGNREQEVSTISRALKALAKDLNVPIIALSQLNRSVEMRTGDKRPHLSDLRESGAIEQDADVVIFIHRAEKYGLTVDQDDLPTKGVAELIIAKHRNGPIADIKVKFREAYAQFVDEDPYFSPDISNLDNKSGSIVLSSKLNHDSINKNEDLTENKRIDGNSEKAPF
ncbi:MAG: replicative DNA helicase [Bacteroidota bacterium]